MEKKYLKFGHKLAYGSGDMASNFCYSFVSAFILIYLTDTVGLNAGIVGTLMLLSRILDGITDVISGTIIDRTQHRWGKARFWMIITVPMVAIAEILLFSTPSVNQGFQYAYFFIVYTLLNDFFYTMNNVAYSTLSMFITPNKNERVQLGAFRFIGTTLAGVTVSSATTGLVTTLGGGTTGWRTLAIIYSILFTLLSYVCVLPLKEVTYEKEEEHVQQEKLSFWETMKYLVRNKFFLQQLSVGVLYNSFQNILSSVGIYYMTYIMGDASLLGVFSLTMMGLILGLICSPFMVKKWGLYKTNLYTMIVTCVVDVFFIGAALIQNLPLMLITNLLRWIFCGPYIGNGGALTAEISTYTLKRDKVHIEASMFASSSMGVKLGAGIGTALAGWILELGGYVGTAAVQPASALSAISFMYIWLPIVFHIVIAIILSFQKVEKANAEIN